MEMKLNKEKDTNIKLNESMTPKTSMSKELYDIVQGCISNLLSIGIDDPKDTNFFRDIEYWEGDSSNTFGVTMYPRNEFEKFKIVLNKYMKDEPREAIENTIYHELAHYIQAKSLLRRGLWYYDAYGQLKGTNQYFAHKGTYGGHGKEWQSIANKISRELKLPKEITRTDSYEFHTGVGEKVKERQRYIVTCKNCGNVMKYEKATDFVKNPNVSYYDAVLKKYGYDGVNRVFSKERQEEMKKDSYWSCGKCGKHNTFKVHDNKTGEEWE